MFNVLQMKVDFCIVISRNCVQEQEIHVKSTWLRISGDAERDW